MWQNYFWGLVTPGTPPSPRPHRGPSQLSQSAVCGSHIWSWLSPGSLPALPAWIPVSSMWPQGSAPPTLCLGQCCVRWLLFPLELPSHRLLLENILQLRRLPLPDASSPPCLHQGNLQVDPRATALPLGGEGRLRAACAGGLWGDIGEQFRTPSFDSGAQSKQFKDTWVPALTSWSGRWSSRWFRCFPLLSCWGLGWGWVGCGKTGAQNNS